MYVGPSTALMASQPVGLHALSMPWSLWITWMAALLTRWPVRAGGVPRWQWTAVQSTAWWTFYRYVDSPHVASLLGQANSQTSQVFRNSGYRVGGLVL